MWPPLCGMDEERREAPNLINYTFFFDRIFFVAGETRSSRVWIGAACELEMGIWEGGGEAKSNLDRTLYLAQGWIPRAILPLPQFAHSLAEGKLPTILHRLVLYVEVSRCSVVRERKNSLCLLYPCPQSIIFNLGYCHFMRLNGPAVNCLPV